MAPAPCGTRHWRRPGRAGVSRRRSTEIIAISSGKGGTGKTLVAACLGYSLNKAGHQVLMIDADPGTDGLSLFLLGPEGMDTVEKDVQPKNTFRYVLEDPNSGRTGILAPFSIHRREDGHRV
ncbi:MAG: septum site-determining protein MinD, partial [bacterium]|nr:septum site-determining protein MinD [bacterium]